MPATIRTDGRGKLAVSDTRPLAEWRGVVHVPAEGLAGQPGLGYPMVGRGWLALEAEGGLEALETTWLEFEVGSPDQDSPLPWPSDVHPLAPTEFDWLAACRPAAECSLPITLTLRWDPWSERDGEPAREGSMSLSFSLTVLLEYFDLAEPPPGAELRLGELEPLRSVPIQ